MNQPHQNLINIDTKAHYIDGSWYKGESGAIETLINPSHETIYGTLAFVSEEQTKKAIKAAKTAFPLWAQTSKAERYRFIESILVNYQQKMKEMAKIISIEMGAPIDFAYHSQTKAGEDNIKNFLKIFKDFSFEKALSKEDPEAKLFLHPLGVAALITPWNWPIHQITLKVIAALLAGCTIILKPSELTPLSAYLFAQMIENAALPKGVFNLIHGKGEQIGSLLSRDKDIALVSFTGSTRAGRMITAQSAATLKKVTLELGGKGANLLLKDCDDKALERAIYKIMRNSGQSCNAPSRLLIDKSLYEKTLTQAKTIVKNITIDHSEKHGNHIGPLASQKQYTQVRFYIENALKEGAKLLCGGLERPDHLLKGYFVLPTIFYDVTPDMKIFQEEIFGPVLAITPFDNLEEAISLANNSPYGLTHYIQTKDKEKAYQIAKKLYSGMVEINGHFLPNDSFFGGIKASGYAREGGIMGIEEYCYQQAVTRCYS